MENKNKLPLRVGVGIVLLNNDNKIFVGKRIDNPNNFWQMPQGGVDGNENFFDATKRELEEETGVKSIKLIKELNSWFEYQLPGNLIGKIWKGKYSGQKKKWFVVKFIGKENEINIKTIKPEFLDWKWIKPKELTELVVDFKLNVYKKIQNELKSLNLF